MQPVNHIETGRKPETPWPVRSPGHLRDHALLPEDGRSAVDGDGNLEKESGGWGHHAQKNDPFFALGRPCIIRLLCNPVACPRGSLIRGMGRHFMCGSTVCFIS